jgi:transposase
LWRRRKKDKLPIGHKRTRKGSPKMKGAQWMDIQSDRQKGLSYVELGRKYHMDPRTAKRYAESPQKPEYTLSEPKPT